MTTPEKLLTQIAIWNDERPNMYGNNYELVGGQIQALHLLAGEVDEAKEASQGKTLDELKVDDDFKNELADIFIYTLSIAHALGIDLYEQSLEKTAFNMVRYPAHTYQNGTSFQDAHDWNKIWAKRRRLKEEFYEQAES